MPDHLTPEILVQAYAEGLFPMADSRGGGLGFYAADPRGVIPLETGGFHVRRSLAKALRKVAASPEPFLLRTDTAFAAVVAGCAEASPGREETWISPEIERVYGELHALGLAHSVEAWVVAADGTEKLVGGLYGVSLGGAFFGESMFSRVPHASQFCLVETVRLLREGGYALFDTQMGNPHLAQFGCVEIAEGEYRRRLRKALRVEAVFVSLSGRQRRPGI